MPTNVRNRLWALDLFYVLGMILLIVSGFAMMKAFNQVKESQAWVKHTHEVSTELSQTYASLKDCESAFRNSVLTHDPEFLSVYAKDKSDLYLHVEKLRTMTIDNPNQIQNVALLTPLIDQRLHSLDLSIQGSKKEATQKIKEQFTIPAQVARENSIQARLESMAREEINLLAQRDQVNLANESRFYAILFGAGTLIIIGLSFGFLNIRHSQIATARENENRMQEAWRKSVLADVARLVTGDIVPEVASHRILNYLSTKLAIAAGNFYVLKGGGLELITSFGLGNKQTESPNDQDAVQTSAPRRLEFGKNQSSLTLEAFNFTKPQELRNVPSDYLWIRSTLGSSAPTSLLFLPVPFLGTNIGIFELASFTTFKSENIQLLEQIAETIGAGINSAASRERTQQLLEETQMQSEELQTQQEELRTTNEELEQQARALESQQKILNIRNRELDLSRRDSESKAGDLEKVNQYKSEFLAKMSHELRTPLNSLLILTTLLIENKEKNLTAQQIEFSKTIQNSGNDLLNIINDILDLSKIEAKKLSLNPELFTIQNLMDHMHSMFKTQIETKGLAFNVTSGPEVKNKEIYTDRQRLEQVLRNFLSNSIKFTETGFINILITMPHPHTFRFTVEDSGVGIAQNKLQKIFEAFEQADGSVSRKYGGTGLGLTISRELAQLLEGNISLESNEGTGSRFTIELPDKISEPMRQDSSQLTQEMKNADKYFSPAATTLRKISQQSETKAAADPQLNFNGTPKTKSILIVEDDEEFRQLIADAAKSYNFESLIAGDAETALELLKSNSPDAIMLDIKLPGLSGMGLLELIKNMPHLRHVPVHMMSALEYQHSALRMGAAGYLGKPVKLDNLRSALSRLESMISKRVKRLLIIEDDARQRESMIALIGSQELEIEVALNGAEALSAIENKSFDCVILDLTLPDMSGFDLLGRLGELKLALPPIVIYTARDLSQQEEIYLRKHSESIIIKGVRSPERLLDEVNLFLHRIEHTLPQEKQDMLSQMREQRNSLAGRTVLLVDDDLRNIFALTSALEDKQLNVRVARNGFEALEQLDQHEDIEIVLMDLMMPKMDGLEAMKRIRQQKKFADLPIVALTAKAMKGDHERCIQAGANDYLPKPIEMPNLISILNVWLGKHNVFSKD